MIITPTLAPRIAPMIGINAPNAVTTPIIEAYGIRKIVIPIKHEIPKMAASLH